MLSCKTLVRQIEICVHSNHSLTIGKHFHQGLPASLFAGMEIQQKTMVIDFLDNGIISLCIDYLVFKDKSNLHSIGTNRHSQRELNTKHFTGIDLIPVERKFLRGIVLCQRSAHFSE